MISNSELTFKTRLFNSLRKIFLLPFFERLLNKFTHEKLVTSFTGRMVPNNYQYPEKSIREFIRNGIRFKTDISDYVGHYLYFGFKDPSISKLFGLVNKGDTVFDIGANIGYTLLNLAKTTGNEGKVIGFEPDAFNFSQCTHNINLNNFNNIEIHNLGLGQTNNLFNLYIDSSRNRGVNKILTDAKGIGKEFSTVKVITLDEWVAEHSPTKPDIIKIDTEGYELNVLYGAKNTLANYSPVLFVEIDNNNLGIQGHSAKQVIQFLIAMGYRIERADNSDSIDPSYNFSNCHFDVICRKIKE